MKTRHIRTLFLCCPSLLALTLAPMQAHAQSQSILPFTSKGYVGLNIGKPSYGTPCGASTALSCEDAKAAFKLYTGGMVNQYLGMELAYLNTGNAERAGGSTKAQGVDFSLVGRVPLGERFHAFARGGGTYGRTSISADIASGLSPAYTGKASGWGKSYGAGIGFDLSPSSAIVLDWGRNDFRFAGFGRAGVKATSLGFVQRF